MKRAVLTLVLAAWLGQERLGPLKILSVLLSIVSVQDQKITALAQLVGILMEQQKLVEKEHRPGGDEREADGEGRKAA